MVKKVRCAAAHEKIRRTLSEFFGGFGLREDEHWQVDRVTESVTEKGVPLKMVTLNLTLKRGNAPSFAVAALSEDGKQVLAYSQVRVEKNSFNRELKRLFPKGKTAYFEPIMSCRTLPRWMAKIFKNKFSLAFGVKKGFSRKGVGTALMRELLLETRRREIEVVELSGFTNRAWRNTLIKKLGARPAKRFLQDAVYWIPKEFAEREARRLPAASR
ncbi:MAG: hypothetical protein QW343_03320 [Candidatus Norongarragalinales archaeon]